MGVKKERDRPDSFGWWNLPRSSSVKLDASVGVSDEMLRAGAAILFGPCRDLEHDDVLEVAEKCFRAMSAAAEADV